ncbi:MAG: hypothetical protein AAGA30_14450, partial [Planctomycetota bacterium]
MRPLFNAVLLPNMLGMNLEPRKKLVDRNVTASRQRQNFWVLVGYQILLRTGWIFKTESVIMPAVLDAIGGNGLLRGCLPMLNRIGQSLPPIVLAERLRVIRLKKRILMACVLMMGGSFLLMAIVWFNSGSRVPNWLPYFFLFIYGFFWVCVGVHNLSLSLIYGKLIVAEKRGQLMFAAMVLGSVCAISCAWFLMKPW